MALARSRGQRNRTSQVRTIPNAARLGRAKGSVEAQTTLARAIYRDHIYCLAAMTIVLALQLNRSR